MNEIEYDKMLGREFHAVLMDEIEEAAFICEYLDRVEELDLYVSSVPEDRFDTGEEDGYLIELLEIYEKFSDKNWINWHISDKALSILKRFL